MKLEREWLLHCEWWWNQQKLLTREKPKGEPQWSEDWRKGSRKVNMHESTGSDWSSLLAEVLKRRGRKGGGRYYCSDIWWCSSAHAGGRCNSLFRTTWCFDGNVLFRGRRVPHLSWWVCRHRSNQFDNLRTEMHIVPLCPRFMRVSAAPLDDCLRTIEWQYTHTLVYDPSDSITIYSSR